MKNILVSRLEDCFMSLSNGTLKTNIFAIESFMNDGNVFVLRIDNQFTENTKRMLLAENIKFDYISAGNNRITYDYNGQKTINRYAGNNRDIECIKDMYKIDDYNIYTITSKSIDVEMIKDYNGYAVDNADKIIRQEALNKCESVAQLVKMITNNTALKKN